MNKLLEYCNTPRQREVIEAILSTGSQGKAARLLGIDKRNVELTVARVRKHAARHGYAPDSGLTRPAPPGTGWQGTSTLYNESGEVKLQWVKTKAISESIADALQDAIQGFIADVPAVKVPPAPKNCSSDIIPWFQIGDGHLGMVAYDVEVGQSFDLNIAERELCTAMAMLIDACEPCERCVIQDLGDMTHYETFAAKTELSGHDLDFDSRYPRMIKTYSKVMRFIVDRALQKFRHVDIIINQGNHSRSNDVWMAELLKVAYSKTKRVHVLENSSVFIPYRMGNTFVMCHHSDKCRPSKLAQVMATDFRQDWGETEYHYIDIGHIHHSMVSKEHPGVKIESWNQLATGDKYAHDGGWRSRSCLSVVYRSKTYGEIGRRTLTLEQVRDKLSKAKPGTTAQARRDVYTV